MKIELFSDRAIGGEVTSDGDFLLFENNRYTRKGFLFKSFVMSAIVSTNYLNQLHRWFSLFFFFVGMNSIDTIHLTCDRLLKVWSLHWQSWKSLKTHQKERKWSVCIAWEINEINCSIYDLLSVLPYSIEQYRNIYLTYMYIFDKN